MFCTCIQSGSSHNVVHSSSYLIAELIEYVLTKPKECKEMMGGPLRVKNTAIHSPIATSDLESSSSDTDVSCCHR